MLQAVVTLGPKTPEGQIIEAVSIRLAFLEHIKGNPSSMNEIDWRKWEEIIAGAYSAAGYSVVLTPRSGDRGRDVIATKQGLLSVRYFDQVKAYSPGKLVKLDDVHAMLGVLSVAGNVSKGISTRWPIAPKVVSRNQVDERAGVNRHCYREATRGVSARERARSGLNSPIRENIMCRRRNRRVSSSCSAAVLPSGSRVASSTMRPTPTSRFGWGGP